MASALTEHQSRQNCRKVEVRFPGNGFKNEFSEAAAEPWSHLWFGAPLGAGSPEGSSDSALKNGGYLPTKPQGTAPPLHSITGILRSSEQTFSRRCDGHLRPRARETGDRAGLGEAARAGRRKPRAGCRVVGQHRAGSALHTPGTA